MPAEWDATNNSSDQQKPKTSSRAELQRRWTEASTLSPPLLELCNQVEDIVTETYVVNSKVKEATIFAANPVAGDAENLEDTSRKDASTNKSAMVKFDDALDALNAVHTVEDFQSWYGGIKKRLNDENEQTYRRLIARLRSGRASCEELMLGTEESYSALLSVKESRAQVLDATSRLRSECESLIGERQRLMELADGLRRRLTYFEELENLSVKLGSGKDAVDPADPQYTNLLSRLDECIVYASSSSGAVAEADGYLFKFLELQRKACSLIKEHVVSSLDAATQQVLKDISVGGGRRRVMQEGDLTDASKEYLHFRTIAPSVKVLTTELHKRAQSQKTRAKGGDSSLQSRATSDRAVSRPLLSTQTVALGALGDCEESYMEQRRKLLTPNVSAYLKSIGDVSSIIDFVRQSSSYLIQLCEAESTLYEHFFPLEPDGDCPALLAILESFGSRFYEELRSRIVLNSDLDMLVYLVEVLRTEMLGAEVQRKGFASKALSTSALRSVADAQERIIYLAEVFIRDEIKGFVAKSAHLQYPEVILNVHNKPEGGELGNALMGSARPHVYSTWYPPLERTLQLLSMMYRCVDTQVFAGIAQEAVAVCVSALRSASARISRSGKANAVDHGELFLIWQLLMLREQTAPFDVDLAYTERKLDFKELRSLLGNVIRGQESFRALARPPEAMKDTTTDLREELERSFQRACEAFILRMTRMMLDPVLSFLAKCSAIPMKAKAQSLSTGASGGENGDGGGEGRGDGAPSQPLASSAELALLDPSAVVSIWDMCDQGIRSNLPGLMERIKVYLTKSSSRDILLRTVRSTISEALNELLTTLQARFTLDEREQMAVDGRTVEGLLRFVDAEMGLSPATPREARASSPTQS